MSIVTTMYGYYTSSPVLADTLRISLERSFTACMLLLMAANLFGLRRRCYNLLSHFCTVL